MALWVAVTFVVAGGAVGWTMHASRVKAMRVCERVDGWDATTRQRVGAALAGQTFSSPRILAAIDARAAEVKHLLSTTCRTEAAIDRDRTRLCLALVWRETAQHL